MRREGLGIAVIIAKLKSELARGAPHQSSLAEEGIPEFAGLQATVEPSASPPILFLLEALSHSKYRIEVGECRSRNFPQNLRRGTAARFGIRAKKKRPPVGGLRIMLASVVALPPSIDVPRTIMIRLTTTALQTPSRWAAVGVATVSGTAVVVVIAVTMAVPISRRWQRTADSNYADDA
jgi:hypothetical protein